MGQPGSLRRAGIEPGRQFEADQRSATRLRGHGHAPLQGAHPLGHAHQSETRGLQKGIEAPPVILYRSNHSRCVLLYDDRDAAGVGMLAAIGHGLLNGAVQT